jgi:cobalt-zinc-cadmium efflux system outer membrane protein
MVVWVIPARAVYRLMRSEPIRKAKNLPGRPLQVGMSGGLAVPPRSQEGDQVMARQVVAGSLALALLLGLAATCVQAQAPQIDTGTPPGPGSNASMFGPSPGANNSTLGSQPGSGAGGQAAYASAAPISGKLGAGATRAPASISRAGSEGFAIPPQMGISAPAPTPPPEAPAYGMLAEPTGPEDEGPPGGLTLDQAIEQMVRDSLDLRAQFFEIPQARADILSASLRANPVFYADSQLIPYGQYSLSRPGGPLQYDVNISYPFDLSHKRQARTRSATRALRVLEAQYQDAVRTQVDNLYTAYVDVLDARESVRYAKASLDALEKILERQRALAVDEKAMADYSRGLIERNTAAIGVIEAEAKLVKTKRALGTMLYLPPEEAERLEVRGTIRDVAPLPPGRDELLRIALESRPDLTAFRLGVQRAQADVRLAKANRLQDVYLLYQPYTFQNNTPFGTRSATSWALGITVPLPIYNRNQGGIQRAELNVTQTQIQMAALIRQIITDVQQAEQDYALSRQDALRIERYMLPPARQVRDSVRTQLQGGEVSLIDYLTALKDYNNIVKTYRDTVVRHRRSMLDLNTAVGQRILP